MPGNPVYIVDDDRSMRDALTRSLQHKGYSAKSFSDPLELLAAIDCQSPGVIILDVEMPNMSGLELQQELASRGVVIPIIFISGRSHPKQIIQGMKKGALDFILKPFELDELISSLEEALTRAKRASEADDETRHLTEKYASLTNREREIFKAIGEGEMLKEIANRLGVSNSVVKFHKSNIMRKLKCQTLSDLVSYYVNLKRLQSSGSCRL